jgi:hypothetical protein
VSRLIIINLFKYIIFFCNLVIKGKEGGIEGERGGGKLYLIVCVEWIRREQGSCDVSHLSRVPKECILVWTS